MFSHFRKTFARSSGAQRGRGRPSPAAAEKKKFDWSTVGKFTKPIFIVGGLIYFVRRSMGGIDEDQLNKSLKPANPQKPLGKLIVTKMEDKLMCYDAAFMAAQKSAKSALARKARMQQLKMVDAEFETLSEEQITQLLELGKQMRHANKELGKSSKMAKELLQFQFLKKPTSETPPPGAAEATTPPKPSESATDGDGSQPESTTPGLPGIPPGATVLVDPKTGHKTVVVPASKDEIMAEQIMIQTLQAKLRNEINLMKNIERILSSKQKSQLMMIRRPNVVVDILSSLIDADPLTQFDFIFDKIHHLQVLPKSDPPKVYVLDFKGDVMATQVDKLREEVTGVLANIDPKRGDRVILTLHSGGGSVTGYGLASAQLNRLKVAGVPLTVCVDEVAASGGYMMAAVADKIVASPFAILGSVGVITTVPNFSSRLLREGVEVEDITAGKYKRTMTPYKKSTPEDRAKTKSDIEDVFTLFKDFLKAQRPLLDVEKIATGEVWFGPDALKRGLCDELQTSDDCILNARKSGAEVYKVELIYQQPSAGLANQLISAAFGSNPFSIDSEAAGDRMEGENALMYYARKVLTNAAMSYFGNASQVGGQASGLPVGMQNVMSQLNGGGEEVPVNRRFMAVDESVTGGRGPRF